MDFIDELFNHLPYYKDPSNQSRRGFDLFFKKREGPISKDDDGRQQKEEGQGRRGGDATSSSAYPRSPREDDEEESFFRATRRGRRRETAGVPGGGARSRGAHPLHPRGRRRRAGPEATRSSYNKILTIGVFT